MKFSFIHAADLHLGSPFAGLGLKSGDVALQFAKASRDAFSALVDAALAEAVAFMVISGDVYDADWRDTSIGLFFSRELSRLHRADIPVFLIKGNHDAASEITKSVLLPPNTYEFPAKAPATRENAALKVAIHGQSFENRAVPENLARNYPPPRNGWLNIGLLHTSCIGSPEHDSYAPCSVEDLARHGYDYWALGHIHQRQILSRDPWIVFSGNLQGRSIRECGAKGAMIVDVEDGRIAGVRELNVDRARWCALELDATVAMTRDDLGRMIETDMRAHLIEAGDRPLAVRVTITGETHLHRALKADAAQWRDDVEARLRFLSEDVWLEKLALKTREKKEPRSETADAMDPDVLLAEMEHDPAHRENAMALFKTVLDKLPPGAERDALEDEFDAIFADARALVLGRAATTR
jgi:exonuclease SbcD